MRKLSRAPSVTATFHRDDKCCVVSGTVSMQLDALRSLLRNGDNCSYPPKLSRKDLKGLACPLYSKQEGVLLLKNF